MEFLRTTALGQIEKYRNQAKQGMSCSHGAGSMPPVCWERQLCVSCEFVTINSRCMDFFSEHRHKSRRDSGRWAHDQYVYSRILRMWGICPGKRPHGPDLSSTGAEQ